MFPLLSAGIQNTASVAAYQGATEGGSRHKGIEVQREGEREGGQMEGMREHARDGWSWHQGIEVTLFLGHSHLESFLLAVCNTEGEGLGDLHAVISGVDTMGGGLRPTKNFEVLSCIIRLRAGG